LFYVKKNKIKKKQRNKEMINKRRITYYVQRYRPRYEAISKEVSVLANYFSKENRVKIHDLHLDGLFNFKFNRKRSSYHFFYYPVLFLHSYCLSKRSNVNHIYTSLGDLPYLNIINLNTTILTAAASCKIKKIKKRIKRLKKLKKIVVESNKQKEELLELGINPNKVRVIYPPVNLKEFNYYKPKGDFKILYASCPTRLSDFKKRGINLIIETAKKHQSAKFILAWRKGAYLDIKQLINKSSLKNIIIDNRIINDMNEIYGRTHCTIIPYTKHDNYLKLIPNSALESLAAGKPILVSNKTEIAAFVDKERCGVVFEPNETSLLKAIIKLKNNYTKYQKNCRKTANKYFSRDDFVKEYEKIYKKI